MTDEDYMEIALNEAKKAYKKDEVPVGAVVVDLADGKIISKGHNQTQYGQDITAHAEISAIRKALKKTKSKRLFNHALYVTLEPCAMCTAAISFARIKKLVIGTPDSKGGAVLNGVRFYESPTCHSKPEVISGILAEESASILKDFFKNKRT